MSTRRSNHLTLPSVVVACLGLAACADTTAGSSTDTSAFVRNALDTYGVVDVVPAASLAPAPVATSAPADPLGLADTPSSGSEPRRMSLAEACRGKTGVQRGLLDAKTRQPIDCGPASSAAPTS